MLYLLKFYLNSLLTMSIDVSHLLRNNLFVKYLHDFMSRIYVTGVMCVCVCACVCVCVC